MEEISFLIKGIVIGFSIAAPVGPIGVLCISKTLTYGRLSGFISGMGAATADAIYGAIAGFGLAIISNFLVEQTFHLKLIGGIFLIYLGIRTFIKKSKAEKKEVKHKNLITDYVSTFFLTLTNPTTILSFIAVFAGLGLADTSGDMGLASMLVLGVFLGSALWWLILSEGVGLIHRRIGIKSLTWVNRISGLIIGGFGVAAIISLII